MTHLRIIGAMFALSLTTLAHADNAALAAQREYKTAGAVVVTTMPAALDLATAQARLRAFLIDQEAVIERDEPGVIEARTPFGVDPNERSVDFALGMGVFADSARKMQDADGHVFWKHRVIRLSQAAGEPVRVEWCQNTARHIVQGTATPVRVVCKVSFLEWKLLREATASLSSTPVESGVVSMQGAAAEVRP